MKTAKILSVLLLMWSVAVAADDEMSTEVKPGTAVPGSPPPAVETKPAAPTAKPTAGKKLDPSLRAKIRKRAPFWIDDANHGAAIRVNKDGTFSSESQGGGSIAGTWKAYLEEIFFTWSDGGDQYGYPVKVKKGNILIHGKAAKKNRFKLGSGS